MKSTDPQKFDSVVDWLQAMGFAVDTDGFRKDGTFIPADQVIGHNPRTFEEKAVRLGWVAKQ